MRLPKELCFWIIRRFQDDPRTLRKLSLVHRSWTREAQKVLFARHSVRIGVLEDATSFALGTKGQACDPYEFLLRIQKSTHLCGCIQVMRINLASIHQIFMSTHKSDAIWTFEDILDVAISSQLSQLQDLTLFSMDTSRFYNKTISLPTLQVLSPALQGCLSSLTRMDLHADYPLAINFTDFQSLKTLLCALPKLEDFSCSYLTYTSSIFTPTPDDTLLSLRHLKISCYDSLTDPDECFLTWLLTTKTLQSLIDMTVHFRSYTDKLGALWRRLESPFSLHVYVPMSKFSAIDQTLYSHIYSNSGRNQTYMYMPSTGGVDAARAPL
jgi:hypothetical protein